MTATLTTATGRTHRLSELREVIGNYFVADGDRDRGAFGAKARTACGRTYEGLAFPDGSGVNTTCTKCEDAEDAAPVTKTVPAAAARAEVTASVTDLGIRLSTDRFYATRANGRYRVVDGDLIDARQDGDAPGTAYVATCSSRAKAEEKAAALNDAAAAAAHPGADLGPVVADTVEAAGGAVRPSGWAEREVEEAAAKADAAKADALAADAILAAVSPAAAKGVTRTEDGAVILASGLVEGSPEANAAERAEADAFEAILAAEKTRAVRFHGRVGGLLLGALAVADGPAAPILARLAAAKILTDGGRSIPTTAAERAALRTLVSDRVAAEESATEPTLTVTDRNSLRAFLRSVWMSA